MKECPIDKDYFRKITDNPSWDLETVKIFDSVVEWINETTFNLDLYPNQYEIVTSEQMLDAYSLTGLPLSYTHWKFGKDFSMNENRYKRGQMGLSYEMVINCLKYDSKVMSNRGIINIQNLSKGDKIWNGREYVEVVNITKSQKSGNDILLENNKKISASSYHVFPTFTKSGVVDKRVDELSENDFLLLNKKEVVLENITDFRGYEYTPPVDKNNKFKYTKYCKIPDTMTPELSELVGIIIGDGAMGHTTTKACSIIIGHPDIDDGNNYDQYVSSLIKKVFDIDPNIGSVYSENGENKVLHILSTEIKGFFNYIGLHDTFTHKTKRVPESIFKSGTLNIKSFLRGLFDTDGTYKNGYIRYSGYNHDLINDIYILLNSIGINPKINIVDNKHQKISGITIPSYYRDLFLKEVGSSIPRKLIDLNKEKSIFSNGYNSFNKTPEFLIEKYQSKINKRYGIKSMGKFLSNVGVSNLSPDDIDILSNYDVIKIKDISETNQDDTYVDITVESSDHYFCSEGIITHNCNPCISYNMEENTTVLTLLVMIHAGIGHNAFFKNNYFFKQWTHADSIIDYMKFAKDYISKCEEKYGEEEVEKVLDACHSLMNYGVSKYKKPYDLDIDEEVNRVDKLDMDDFNWSNHHLWRKTLPKKEKVEEVDDTKISPEENILYFIEKNSPVLKVWQKEIVRIVRKISQYFYPQAQTKTINEGTATYIHHTLVNELSDRGFLSDKFMLEFYKHHSNVVYQPDQNRFNPYTLGFNIFKDVERIVKNPTQEDKEWFPDLIGRDWTEVFKDMIEGYKDDSFIHQFLSPKVMRDMKMFSIHDEEDSTRYLVTNIHDDSGYKEIREKLANSYNRSSYVPEINVVNVDWFGDRTLTLEYTPYKDKKLDEDSMEDVVDYIHSLWGFEVKLINDKGRTIYRKG